MIISFKHSFIFLNTRKSAGSTMAVTLSRYLSGKDLQFSAIEETIMHGISLPLRLKINACLNLNPFDLMLLVNSQSLAKPFSNAIKRKYTKKFSMRASHPYATHVKAQYPSEFESFFKFAIVRNPYTRVVSDYLWRVRNIKNPPEFRDFIDAIKRNNSLKGINPMHENWKVYTINDKPIVDMIIKFENLQTDIKDTLKNIETIQWDGWLPHIKSISHKPNYEFYYTKKIKSEVSNIYKKEIELFDYDIDF